MSELPRQSIGRYRWVICALLFFATTINYIDRGVIGILKPTLDQELGWTEVDYANIVTAFQVAYALGYLFNGALIDRIGVRFGYSLAVFVWSLAAMAHAFARSVLGFSIARFGLGISEGANFPACVKAVSEWFPRKERALATGLFNAGSNVGALLTPLVVPLLLKYYDWEACFIWTGSLGFLWLFFFFPIYRSPEKHSRVSKEELAYIQSEPADPPAKFSWFKLLRYRQTWAIVVGMFMSAPIWWFYLYWIPDFLYKEYHLQILQLMAPLVTIYLMTDVGSIAGGWFSGWLINRGWSVNAARKTTLLICALCVVPVFLAAIVPNLWVATILIGLAASAHQGFSANLYTLVSDMAPRKAVSSIVGLGGMAGAIGGMGIAQLAGYVLQWTGSYVPLFVIASCAYLINLLIIHLLVPRLEPMDIAVSELPA